jgi:biotin carboxyl carrier protein
MREWDSDSPAGASIGTRLPFRSTRADIGPAPSLADTLTAVGGLRTVSIERARGWLQKWFAAESGILTALNTGLSLVLFALALTMTFVGMKIAQMLGLVVTLNEATNAISPYAGVALLSLGSLRLVQNALSNNGPVARVLGVIEAMILIAGGIWAEAVAWYTGAIPDILKPQLEFAGGAITAHIIFFSTVVVPFFKPAIATGLGALLTAKHLKTTVTSGDARTRWYIAVIGLLASACTLIIGMDASQRHLTGTKVTHDISAANAPLWVSDFASPFAQGTWCRVSDTFGPRRNPFWGMKPKTPPAVAGAVTAGTATPVAAAASAPASVPLADATPVTADAAPAPALDAPSAPVTVAAATTPATPAASTAAKPEAPHRPISRIENHPGVDLAAREGTPVRAIADGRIVYAGFDEGFGNAVALSTHVRDGQIAVLTGHMKAINVHSGDAVSKGTIIGWVGSTGASTGPHLHVQVCPKGQAYGGSFRCGEPMNPYEEWATLSAIARLSCVSGPVGGS